MCVCVWGGNEKDGAHSASLENLPNSEPQTEQMTLRFAQCPSPQPPARPQVRDADAQAPRGPRDRGSQQLGWSQGSRSTG